MPQMTSCRRIHSKAAVSVMCTAQNPPSLLPRQHMRDPGPKLPRGTSTRFYAARRIASNPRPR